MGKFQRRQLLIASGALLSAQRSLAQQQSKTRTLGLIGVGLRPTAEADAAHPVFARLRELGWIEGQNLVIERSYAEGRTDLLPELAAELIAKRPDVIWTHNPEAAIAVARATKTIPLVFWSVPFPVEQGLIDSFARPGHNVTGVAFFPGIEVATKRLELLRNCAPDIKRVAWIQSANILGMVAGGTYRAGTKAADIAAQNLGLKLQHYWIETREDLDAMFTSIVTLRVQAFAMPVNQLLWQHRQLIIDFAMRNRLPNVSGFSGFVEAGGLASYGADQNDMAAYSIRYVDKILRGAKPADLPVEIPNRYVLAVNVKAAKELGLKISQSVLLRADQVIE